MTSVASGGAADRIVARILFKVLRAGSGTPARYSSTFFGVTLPFAAVPRSLEFAFVIRVILTPVPVIQYLFLRKHESHGGLSMLAKLKSPLARALLLISKPSLLALHRLRFGGIALLRRQTGVVALRDGLLCVLGQLLRLGQQVERFLHLRIVFGVDLHAFLLAEFVDEQLGLDVGTDPAAVLRQVSFGEGNFLLVEKLAELLHHGLVNFKLFAHFVIDDVVLGEVEERVFLQHRVLKLIGLDAGNLGVGRDAAAAVHGPPAVGHLDFVVGSAGVSVIAVVVIVVVERDIAVIALNQAAAGSVVLGRGQRQAGVIRKRIDGLHQAFAEGGLTRDEAAIVVLDGARDDLSRRSGAAIHQHHQRIILAAIAVCRLVNLLSRSASVMGNDDLTLLQELVIVSHHGRASTEKVYKAAH